MDESECSWSSLPDHVIALIMSKLSVEDRVKAGSTCRAWSTCYKSRAVWNYTVLTFIESYQRQCLKVVANNGAYMRNITINVNQFDAGNRAAACDVLGKFARMPDRFLESLTMAFVGENPLFYAGLDFVEGLKNVFGVPTDACRPHRSLKHVDLGGLYVAFDVSVMDVLSENNPELESVNIINQTQICKVHPDSIVRLIERCKKLTDLRLFHCSLSEKALETFTHPGRTPPKFLSILCRKEERIGKVLKPECWTQLRKHCPELKVKLSFDHTCPYEKISDIMAEDIPVVELCLETHTDIYKEVVQAGQMYHTTLEALVLQTRNSVELADSLIQLCSNCSKLTKLLVYCRLDQEIVEKILDLCPKMRERGTYILKWTMDPEPWLMKVQEGM